MSRTISEQLTIIKQQHRLGVMTHVVMGYPSLHETKQRVLAMAAAGVDSIELQIPFSDPLADGPAITKANQQALAAGVTVQQCLQLAEQLTRAVDIPLQCIGYYNTIHHFGVQQFVQASQAAGIQGFTIPDMPLTEEPYEHFYALAAQANLPVIQLISPATPIERLRLINQHAQAMVYCVSRFGVTGAHTTLPDHLITYLRTVRQYVTLPLAVGFGISTPKHIRALHGLADVAVIGSALLNVSLENLTQQLTNLCAER
ncbi:MAG: tryptophan synthase subunit alpha [Candidatus Kerfeldbacteria bacterium]|nr:tryptophan synthase subunit alpha [Candidatus Kerfeldbacteria bacterium]